MRTGEQWLDWLAAAKVPAFLCRHDGAAVGIIARTSAFEAAVGGGAGWPGETVLLAELAAAWPAGDSPTVFHVADGSGWQCVLQSLERGSCIGILRLTDLRQRYNEAFFATAQALPDIVARLDRNHRHVYINPTIERVTGIPAQAFIGKSKRELGLQPELVAQWEALVDRVLDSELPAEEEHELPTVHGPRDFLTRVVPERGADGTIRTVLTTSHDITQLKSLQRQLALLASTDPLTSLLNRRGFAEALEAEAARVRDGHAQLALLLIDVNDFKVVNDTFGHLAGDDLLVTIGEVLRQEVRGTDFVARLGGDEFCIGLVDTTSDEARDTAERIRARISGLGPEGLSPCEVSVSIGLAVYADTDRSVSDLIARVDEAMYREKSRAAEAP